MDMLKQFFPFAFCVTEKDVKELVISVLIHLAAGLAYSVAAWLIKLVLGWLLGGLLSWLLGIVGAVVGLYVLAGIVLAALKFLGIVK